MSQSKSQLVEYILREFRQQGQEPRDRASFRAAYSRMSVRELKETLELLTGRQYPPEQPKPGPTSTGSGQQSLDFNAKEHKDFTALNILRLMNDPQIEHVDFRVFLDASFYEDEAEAVDAVAMALQAHPALSAMISAYQLRNDGFGNLTPDLDGGPIA